MDRKPLALILSMAILGGLLGLAMYYGVLTGSENDLTKILGGTSMYQEPAPEIAPEAVDLLAGSIIGADLTKDPNPTKEKIDTAYKIAETMMQAKLHRLTIPTPQTAPGEPNG